MSEPERPQDVRVYFTDGTDEPAELYYVGPNEIGHHEWATVEVYEAARLDHVTVWTLPALTSLRVRTDGVLTPGPVSTAEGVPTLRLARPLPPDKQPPAGAAR